MTSGFR